MWAWRTTQLGNDGLIIFRMKFENYNCNLGVYYGISSVAREGALQMVKTIVKQVIIGNFKLKSNRNGSAIIGVHKVGHISAFCGTPNSYSRSCWL